MEIVARMNVRKKIFQGMLILGLMIIVAATSYMVASAQQNNIPSALSLQASQQPSSPPATPPPASSHAPLRPNPAVIPGSTSTTQAGSRLIQIAVSQQVLSSLLSSQFGVQQNMLTDVQVIPTANNGMILQFNIQIATNGINRVLPIEIDSIIELDEQQNVQLQITHLKRDGLDAGALAAMQLQTALNQLLVSLLMPQIHTMLKGMELVGVQTNVALCCVNSEMLVLLLQLD